MDPAPEETEAPKLPTTEAVDALGRLFASTALGLALLALIELAGTVAVGLAVTTERLSFPHRQGYAFLTSLEKSPVTLLLVVAAVFAAVTTLRAQTDSRTAQLARIALWATAVAAVVVGLGAILAVLARFRVAELAPSQPIDSITRRVLFSFIVRNFGAAVLALLVVFGALFRPSAAKPVVVD
ncbi:MAG: hypothetical protein Q8K63_04105 [Acidimicrobiales bacterium]|nr:hypothetical protein [Acidimicrobiales bacterium]